MIFKEIYRFIGSALILTSFGVLAYALFRADVIAELVTLAFAAVDALVGIGLLLLGRGRDAGQ
jgi:hypothetical protein